MGKEKTFNEEDEEDEIVDGFSERKREGNIYLWSPDPSSSLQRRKENSVWSLSGLPTQVRDVALYPPLGVHRFSSTPVAVRIGSCLGRSRRQGCLP